jgi:UDP-glucose:(heptosyl)LPS alpha-1,3-glucosyltransferase
VNIAVVRQRYNPYGGAERFVERATAALAAQGATLTIIAREWSGSSGSAAWLPCDPFHVGRTWRDAAFARAVCKLTAAHRFDLVQSHERLACCDIYRAGDGVHARWLECRGRVSTPLRRVLTACHPYHRYVLTAERRTFTSPRLRAVICNSYMVRDEVKRRFGVNDAKLHVIYNGVDLQHFSPALKAQHRDAVRAKLGLRADARVVLFVGSGFERKGMDALLRALARLQDDTFLLVVGADAAQKRYERLAGVLGIGSRVHWAGGQQDVTPWYGAADVFALPTLYDPFPNAALEALACGLPLVTSRDCGAAELVREDANGFVCSDALDAGELSLRLARTLEGAARMSAEARDSAAPFGIDATAAQLLALYRRLLSASS